MDPALVTTALGDGRDADTLLDRSGIGETLASLADASEKTRREHRTTARESREEVKVWEDLAAFGNIGVEASDAG